MRTLVLIAALIFAFGTINAQEKDTTKIKMGKKKIIIIDSDEVVVESQEKLESGKAEFEDQIADLKVTLEKLKIEKESIKDDEGALAKNEKEIEKTEAKIEALQKGIEDIEREMEALEKKEMGEDGNADSAENEDDDVDWDFDFDMDDIKEKRKKFNGHWAGFEIGWNDFLNADYQKQLPTDAEFMELETRSMELALNFMEYNIPIAEHFGLTTGLGVQWNKYNFKQNITIREVDGVIVAEDAAHDLKMNKLRTTYMNIPLLMEVQIPVGNKDKRFHLAAGVVGGVKLGSKLKQEYKIDGEGYENYVNDDYQINRFRYGVTVRFGYESLRLFANYSLVPLFEEGAAGEIYPFTVGLTLIDF